MSGTTLSDSTEVKLTCRRGWPVTIIEPAPLHAAIMLRVFLRAFADDKSKQLMYRLDTIWPILLDNLERRMKLPEYKVFAGLEVNTSAMVGWISLGLINVPLPDRAQWLAMLDVSTAVAQELLGIKADGSYNALESSRKLIAVLSREMIRGQKQVYQYQRIVINTIVIDPNYRQSGFGHKILQSAANYADQCGLLMFVQIPQQQRAFFEQHSFVQIGSWMLDLSVFVPEEKENGGSWTSKFSGIQEFLHMVRVGKSGVRLRQSACSSQNSC